MRFVSQALSILSDGEFHSGQKLAREMGVTRATVWKAMESAKSSGLDIFAVRGRGYRLPQPLELLDKKTIEKSLSSAAVKKIAALHILWETDSTNRYLLDIAAKEKIDGTVCLAELQTKGRGRRGRVWVSPLGANVYLSLLWRFNVGPDQLSGLSLATAVSVVRAINKQDIDGVGVKWPNDVITEKGKLAGILLEMTGEASGPCTVVAGIGLNIKLSKKSGQQIDQPWTDLSDLSHRPIKRNKLVASLISELVDAFGKFESDGLQSFLPEWRQWDYYEGKPVVLQSANDTIHGVVRGVDDKGALQLVKNGKLSVYHHGEVSLRPLR
jgi:BirA family biotin operon repressor/biotin-[acetyl-CoA-carboxylase] ligase